MSCRCKCCHGEQSLAQTGFTQTLQPNRLSGCISDETKTTSSYLVPENENERQLRRQLLRHITEWSNDFGTSMSLRAIIRAKEEVSLRSGAALKEKILYSYRQVYKEAFRAIRYASPSRYTLRKVINNAFRTAPLSEFNPEKISNTIKFLHNASKENGLEHKIVKSLLHTWWFEGQLERVQPTQVRQFLWLSYH